MVPISWKSVSFSEMGSSCPSQNIQPAGAVSGFIYDAAGEPQAGVAVQIRGLETGFYEAVCSRDNGYYVFTRLPLDSYEVSAGGFGAEDCPPNDMATVTKPEIHVRFEAPVVEGVDFTLAR